VGDLHGRRIGVTIQRNYLYAQAHGFQRNFAPKLTGAEQHEFSGMWR
jgi:hypothetical protein